jgi:uncharacterized membrane protein
MKKNLVKKKNEQESQDSTSISTSSSHVSCAHERYDLLVIASVLILFSAFIDARLAFGLSVFALFSLSFILKGEKTKQVLFTVAIACITAVLIVVFNQGQDITALLFMWLIIGVMIFWTVMKRRTTEVINDERTRALSNKSAAYSWWFNYVLISLLLWFDYSGFMVLSAMQFGGILMFSMLISNSLIKRYLLSKGEAE